MGEREAVAERRSVLGVLRRRDFRLLWTGQALSAVGDPIFPFALAFWAIGEGEGALGVGAIFAARALAIVVAVVAGGVFADRFPRKHVMVAADALRGVVLLAIVVSPSDFPFVVLSALVFVAGIGEAVFRPAYMALVPSLLPAGEVQSGNSLTSATNRVASIAGPALAGVLVTVVGPRGALLADGLTFLVSIATLLGVREARGTGAVERSSILQDAMDGIRAVAARRWIKIEIWLAVVQVTMSLAPWMVLLPVIAEKDLGGGGAYSSLLIAMGVGAFVGALVSGRLRPRRTGVVASLALVPFSFALLGLAAGAPLIVLVPLHVLAGIGTEIYLVLWLTAVQADVPDAILGRVFALDELGSRALMPVAMVVVGVWAEHMDTMPILVFAATVNALTALLPLLLPDVRAFASAPRPAAVPAREGAGT